MNKNALRHTVATFDDEELRQLEKVVKAEKSRRADRRVRDAKDEAREILARYGVTLYEILPPRLKHYARNNLHHL